MRDCTAERKSFEDRGPMSCRNCGYPPSNEIHLTGYREEGHMSRDCPKEECCRNCRYYPPLSMNIVLLSLFRLLSANRSELRVTILASALNP
jgi:hypothetical protein